MLLAQKGYRGRRAQGVRYERKVHEYMLGLAEGAGQSYSHNKWYRFCDGGDRPRWCQPDGLVFDTGTGICTIVEVKYQHTPDAWFQLRELYEPVVTAAVGADWRIALLEVVKWYDPDVYFPERITLCADPLQPKEGHIGVHIWCP